MLKLLSCDVRSVMICRGHAKNLREYILILKTTHSTRGDVMLSKVLMNGRLLLPVYRCYTYAITFRRLQ